MAAAGDTRPTYLMLARVRRSLRAVNNAIARGADAVGLTLQQQAVLLAIAAYRGRRVPFADVREELEMDQATASVLLSRLVSDGLVTRHAGADRRAAEVSLTAKGWKTFRGSIGAIRREMRWADHRGELAPLKDELSPYLRYYLGRPRGSGQGTRKRQTSPEL
jgi:DNA-binding MarR family transcriptional regulator